MTGTEGIEHVNVLNALPPQPLKARLWLLSLLLLLLQQTQRSAEPPLETTEWVQLAGSSRRINCCYSSTDWDRYLQSVPALCVLRPFLSSWEQGKGLSIPVEPLLGGGFVPPAPWDVTNLQCDEDRVILRNWLPAPLHIVAWHVLLGTENDLVVQTGRGTLQAKGLFNLPGKGKK